MKVYLKAKVVKERLIRKNKDQNWLAEHLGISPSYISQLMDGSRNPSPDVRQSFLNIFPDFEFDDLFIVKGK
jgi:transcriptional regulator with XRE-family HTH domain